MIPKLLVAALLVSAAPFFVPLSLAQTTVQGDSSGFTQEQFDGLSSEEQKEFVQSSSEPSLVQSQLQANTDGAVSCFDYYRFGSVQVDIAANLAVVSSGIPLNFSGTIVNSNDYPIVDGQVYAKVFYKNQADESLVRQNGHQLVDQFIVLDDIDLKARGTKPLSFDWQVPQYAQSGEYEMAMYFTSANRFNLLGLTFTDDVAGNKVAFSVRSSASPVISFDKNNVTLNGQPYHFVAFPPRFSRDEKVAARATLINPTDKEAVVTVTWTLYAWDAMLPENLKKTKTETVTLKANEKKELFYETAPIDNPVSYLIAEVKDRDATSILGIRFVRDGIEGARINFPGILKYPLKKGEKNALFACAHSISSPVASDSVLTLTLRDGSGSIIHTYAYDGDMTESMMGMMDSFVPEADISTFTLNATLQSKGRIVEEVTQRYDCNKIDETMCTAKSLSRQGSERGSGQGLNFLKSPAVIIAIVTLIAGALAILLKRRGGKMAAGNGVIK